MKVDQMQKMLIGPIMLMLLAGTSAPALAKDRLISGMVGVGLSYGSTFPGSDESEVGFIPLIDLEIGRYGFLNQRGIGLQNSTTLQNGELRYGLGLGYDFDERISKDDARLNGLPDVKAGALATLFMEYEVGRLTYGFEVQRGLSDDGPKGTLAKLYGTYSRQIGNSNRVQVSATPYLALADDAWMDAFFGVTGDQALASGLTAFDPGSGLAQAGVTLTGSYALTERTILFTSLDLSTLAGDAKDSSISFEDTQVSISTGVLFRF
jgi:outer membrane scaffolding protein for murein synthesis (MipA/OmpV family)